jgi:hypothetical protein
VKQIPLSVTGRLHAGKYCALVDDEDFDRLNQHAWSVVRSCGAVYAYRKMMVAPGESVNVLMHREIFQHTHGPIADGLFIDHRDPGETLGLDNRRSNLRLATNAQNQSNSKAKRNNKSGFKGVHWRDDKQRWHAVITFGRRPHHLGYFCTAHEAAEAYDRAAILQFGVYARTNLSVALC